MSTIKVLSNLILKKQIKNQTGIMKTILPGDKVKAEKKAEFAIESLKNRGNINVNNLTKSDLEFIAEDIVNPIKTAEKTVVKSADILPFRFKRSFSEELEDASKKGDFARMSGIMKLDPQFKEVMKAFNKSKVNQALADERALQTKPIPLDTMQYQSPEVQKLNFKEKLKRTGLTEKEYMDNIVKKGYGVDDVIYARDFYGDTKEDVIRRAAEKGTPIAFADGGVAGLLGERPGYGRGYLVEGAKSLGKKYKGSTLQAILENPKLLGAELGHDGIMELMRLLPGLFADGGPARQNFSMGRRAFLKLMGAAGAGIGASKAGLGSLFKAGKPVTKAAEVITTPNVAGKPAWFDAVVNRVIREGDDVTKQFAYKERMQVNTKQISPTEEVTIYRDLDDGSVRINYGAKMRIDETKPYEKGNISRASNDPDQVDLIVREGKVIEPSIEGPMKGKVGRKTESSFEAGEAEPRAVGGPEDADIEFDGERIVNNVDDLMQDVSTLEEFGTGKKLTGDKAAKAKKKREDYQKFTEDQMEQAEYLETKYGPYDDSAMDDFASGGLAKMLGE